eukprot:TRINITY_DN8385_c0_g1_i3.p1 TRINITY_DN8385_c0_g1~~TRINITY_DN8385_c0_g1_i3.p1  ORF type:complete len:2757 (+),score=715.58 TRINITY_DN8385_c0_g1_i3:987-9257(+)
MYGTEVHSAEELGVWVRNMRVLIEAIDVEKRRLKEQIAKADIQLDQMSEKNVNLVKWLVGILNTNQKPQPGNPLLGVRSRDVHAVYTSPHTASAAEQSSVIAAIHKLLRPAVDEGWVSDVSDTDSESSSSGSSSSSSGTVRHNKRDVIGVMMERKIDAQQKKLAKRAERRSQRSLAAEQLRIVEEHMKKKTEVEAYKSFGVATRDDVVQTISDTLKKMKQENWASSGGLKKIEAAINDVHSGSIDAVCHKVGPLPALVLEAAVKVITHHNTSPTRADSEEAADEQLLPESERSDMIAAIVEKALDSIQTATADMNIIDRLAALENRTLTLLASEAGKDITSFLECKLGTFLEFIRSRDHLSKLLLQKSAVDKQLQRTASSFLDTASGSVPLRSLEEEERNHLEKALLVHLPSCDYDSLGGFNELQAVEPQKTGAIKRHIGAFTTLNKSALDAAEYKVHGITSDGLIKKVLNFPILTELRGALQWDALLASSFGDLISFLSANGVPFMTDGKLWKNKPEEVYLLPSEASPDHFKEAVTNGAGRLAAGILLAMHLDGETSSELLSAYVQAGLKHHVADSSRVLFVKDAITTLPRSAAKIFAKSVFINPLLSIFRGGLNSIYHVSTPEEKKALHEIGCCGGLSTWKNEYEGWLTLLSARPTVTEVPECNTVAEEKAVHVGATEQKKEVVKEANEANEPAKKAQTIENKPGAVVEVASGEPRAVVNSILRYEFGVGADMTDEGKLLHNTSSARLGRAIERLASDLYSSDVHFVLELIQNADDNKYLDGALPRLCFDVTPNAVVVSNNELGFSDKNIRALCDVGSSTKANSEGYIGMKGIGFKSVFRVTSAPEIHSSGYHIKFDLSTGSMGYIMPTWLEDGGHKDRQLAKGGPHPTQIVLPLAGDMATGHRRELLTSKLDDIHPSLLLFVRKLRCIEITDHAKNTTRKMVRYDRGNDVVEVLVNDVPCRWLVQRNVLVPEVSRGDNRGVVSRTELALAFPLLELDDEAQEMMVFAFLPLRSCGLKFVLQGDWTIPSSREDVDAGSPWNQWLRSKVAPLFMASLEAFKNHYSEAHRALSAFLAYVPYGTGVTGFFRPLIEDVRRSMLHAKCLLTTTGVWERPGNVIILPDALCGEPCMLTEVVAPEEEIQTSLRKRYLHPKVVLSSDVTQHLRLDVLGLGHLLDIAKYKIKNHEDTTHGAKNEWLARWLLCVHACLDGRCGATPTGSMRAAVMEEIRALQVMPLTGAARSSFKDGGIFFSKTDDTDPRYDVFLSHMRMLDETMLFTVPEGIPRSSLKQVLTEIGVRPLSPHDVVEKFILPLYSTGQWKKADREMLKATILFINHHRSQVHPSMLQELAKHVVLETNQGLVSAAHSTILFTVGYGNPCRVEYMFKKYLPQVMPNAKDICDWVLLSDMYLEMDTDWASLMETLGVKYFYEVKQKNVKFTDYKKTKWANCEWPFAARGAEVVDYEMRDLENILTKLVEKEAECQGTAVGASILSALRCIAEQLDKDWHHRGYSSKCRATFVGTSDTAAKTSLPSSFAMMLQSLKWLPTSHGILEKPHGLLIESKQASHLLRNTLPTLSLSLKNTSFIETLGIRTDVTADDVIKALQKWQKEAKHRVFFTTLEDMQTVYRFLADAVLTDEECEAICKSPLVYIPARNADVSGTTGSFNLLEDVWWEDALPSVQDLKIAMPHLSSYYPELRSWFVSLKIRLKPTFAEHVKFVAGLAGPPGTVVPYVMQSLVCWNQMLEEGSSLRFHNHQDMLEAKLFQTFHSPTQLFSVSDGLFINDLPEQLGDELKKQELGIIVLSVPLSQVKKALVSLFSVKQLSLVSDIEVSTKYLEWDATNMLHEKLNNTLPYVQRYILTKIPALWKQLSTELECINETGVRVVHEMACKVTVNLKNKRFDASSTCAVIYSNGTLYVKTTHTRQYSKVLGEFFRGVLTAAGSGVYTKKADWEALLEFCHRVVLQLAEDPKGMEIYMIEKHIHPLPPDVEKWVLVSTPQSGVEEMFPKTSGNPSLAKLDRESSITRDEVAQLDAEIGIDKAERERSDTAGDTNPHLEPASGRKRDHDGDGVARPADGVKRRRAEDMNEEDNNDDGGANERQGGFGGKGRKGGDKNEDEHEYKHINDNLPRAVEVSLAQRPLLAILRIWMREGKAQFVAIHRQNMKEKLGIQFVSGTLTIRGHTQDTPAARNPHELPIGFHILACNEIPVENVTELKVQLVKSARVKLIIGCEPYPENPKAYLAEHSPAKDYESDIGRQSEALHEWEDEMLSRLESEGGGGKDRRKGGKGLGGKGGKRAKRQMAAADQLVSGRTAMYDGNGKLLGFLGKNGFEAPDVETSGVDEIIEQDGSATGFCYMCGSKLHKTEKCPMADDANSHLHSMMAPPRPKGAPSHTGGKKGGKQLGKGSKNIAEDRLQRMESRFESGAVGKEMVKFESEEGWAPQPGVMKLQEEGERKETQNDGSGYRTGVEKWGENDQSGKGGKKSGREGDDAKRKRAPNVYDQEQYKKKPKQGDDDDDDGLKKIGRWGEQFVHRYLTNRPNPLQECSWVNEVEETGASYDLVVRKKDPNTGIVTVVYIEVKTTVANAKMFFSVTHRELQFAQIQGSNFHIYRVFAAGSSNARITIIKDPIGEVRRGAIAVSGAVTMTLKPFIARSKIQEIESDALPEMPKPVQTMVLRLTKTDVSDPTGLNIRKDLVINKHIAAPGVTADGEALPGWKIISINDTPVANISELKQTLARSGLNLVICLQAPSVS